MRIKQTEISEYQKKNNENKKNLRQKTHFIQNENQTYIQNMIQERWERRIRLVYIVCIIHAEIE